jgi:multiple sugar transport system substrate-binding protein
MRIPSQPASAADTTPNGVRMTINAAAFWVLSVALASGGLAQAAGAADQRCIGQVRAIRIIAQPMPTVSFLDGVKGEFEKKWDTKLEIQQFGENERRMKSRLDASQGVGTYQVYYVDEANVAEFAASKWTLPLLDYMPQEWDWNDFLEGRRVVATYQGTAWFAPFMGGGDLMMYRKDILAQKGLQPPKNLDELTAVVAALDDPPRLYGTSLRGRRGSGMNVWRWAPFFRAMGGRWFEDDKPVFNSEAAVNATNYYMHLLKYAPPGSSTNTWSEVIEGFRSGQVGLIIESDVLGPWAEDPAKSRIAGNVGYAPPPDPLPSAGFAHGFAISAKGNPTDCSRTVSAEFVAWSTSKQMEARKVKAGILSDFARKSTLDDPDFKSRINPDYVRALRETAPRTDLLIWKSPLWPEVGDDLGLALEQVFTGSQPDIRKALDSAASQAEEVVRRAAGQ